MRVRIESRADLGLNCSAIRGFKDEDDKKGRIIGYVFEAEVQDLWYAKTVSGPRFPCLDSQEAINTVVRETLIAGGVK